MSRLRVRNMRDGQRFQLCRTGEWYTFMGRNRSKVGGTRHMVRRDGSEMHSTLHHSCHVTIAGGEP